MKQRLGDVATLSSGVQLPRGLALCVELVSLQSFRILFAVDLFCINLDVQRRCVTALWISRTEILGASLDLGPQGSSSLASASPWSC